MNQTAILSGLIALCAGLLWRKLDGMEKHMETTDKSIEKVGDRVGALTGDFREFKGKVEALLGIEKKHAQSASEEKVAS